ncbi:hypothetical protein M3P05_19440 [Sansalvadorimonas sp. 2012CJ34-2]|uniref:Uncharacterized protein n=1 Tax=Parendozoicomonas callyspongiae TaxID=2942213 RepID=A0ABT0PL54_9GAMM|nr:hypothetical protein [Sansalvadorimonas sp. 2012CJ34-2]MCL6272100.1 hypothetical protein [Sansalvadorimonas sp. 2012CJ34-2]
MTFSALEFKQRIKHDNPSFREGSSSLSEVSRLIDFYPGLVKPSEFLIEDHKVLKDGQPINFRVSVGPEHEVHGDLLYGINSSRGLEPYKMGDVGKLSICDNYNNAADIGTGLAFGRQWQGNGVLDTTPSNITSWVNMRATRSEQPCRENGIRPGRFAAYAHGLMESRYNPADAWTLPDDRVQKDAQRTPEEIQRVLGQKVKKKELKQHCMAHAHFFKAVRRACKGGIAMAATSPEFAASGARVHFVLDGLGDLATVARKEFFKNCTPITTSELAFCFRYWDKLRDVVHFYLNGIEVKAPWEAQWSANDANGKPVDSGKEAWLRYGLYRDLTGRSMKPFPSGWEIHGTAS